jgi:hypothetical protein
MSPQARRILQLAREGQTPSADDKDRLRGAIGAGIAATAVAVQTANAVASGAHTGSAAASVKAAGALALGTWARTGVLSALTLASAGGATYAWVRHAERAHEVTVARPAASPPSSAVASEPPLATVAPAAPAEPVPEPHARGPAHDPLAAEVALLQRAKQAWQAGKPSVALGLVQRHAQLYPRSQLAAERDAVTVFALCSLGRTSEAHDVATQLLAKSPHSPLRKSLEDSCALRGGGDKEPVSP